MSMDILTMVVIHSWALPKHSNEFFDLIRDQVRADEKEEQVSCDCWPFHDEERLKTGWAVGNSVGLLTSWGHWHDKHLTTFAKRLQTRICIAQDDDGDSKDFHCRILTFQWNFEDSDSMKVEAVGWVDYEQSDTILRREFERDRDARERLHHQICSAVAEAIGLRPPRQGQAMIRGEME